MDPDNMIVDHFPLMDRDFRSSARWQLLASPISANSFNQRYTCTSCICLVAAHGRYRMFLVGEYFIVISNSVVIGQFRLCPKG